MRSRRWLATLAALVVSAPVAACANLPTSGSVRQNSLRGTGGAGQIGVQIVPAPPGRGWRPLEIVNGFLAASASYPNYAVAREYLTAGKHGYGRRWRPGWAATVIDSPRVSLVPPPGHLKQVGGPATALVQVTGQHLARLDTTGRYQAGSVVIAPASTVFRFSLIQVSGQWRIDDIEVGGTKAQPTLLLLTKSDFERDYQPRNLYFYPRRLGANSLIPDPVYIPQAGDNGLSGLVKGLVGALIKGPPGASWLGRAATTAFPRGTVLIGTPQVFGGITAVVNIGGAAAKASPSQQQRMAGQLYWTLTHSPYPAQAANPIQSVVLNVGGRSVRLSPAAYLRYLPRRLAASLYYQAPSSARGPVVVMRASASQHVSVSLPNGLGGETFGTIAVSTAPMGSAVLAGCSGKSVYLMPHSRSNEVVAKRLPTECTSLSWDDHGDLWVAASTQIFEIPDAGSGLPSRPALVHVYVPPYTREHPVFQALRVAPDGVRVALIVRTGSVTKIQVAAISKSAEGTNFTYLAQTGHALRVGSDVTHPVSLTWLDQDNLLVLDRAARGRTELFEVPLNGGKSTEVSTPRGVTSVAATLPPRKRQPRVMVAIAPTGTTPGKIEMARTWLPNLDWEPLVKGITPVFPG